MELLRNNAYSDVMVKDICRKAGVSRSSFYSVFSVKDDILMHVLRGYKDDFEGTMRALLCAGSSLEKLVPVGEKLAFFVVFEWCASCGAFELRERAFDVIEDFYDVAPERRGLRL